MKVRRAIFDKRFFEKKTIMALYATKKAFSDSPFFGDCVQKRRKSPFGYFYNKREESRSAFCQTVMNSLIEVCSGFGLS